MLERAVGVDERRRMIEANHPRLSMTRQCDLLGLPLVQRLLETGSCCHKIYGYQGAWEPQYYVTKGGGCSLREGGVEGRVNTRFNAALRIFHRTN